MQRAIDSSFLVTDSQMPLGRAASDEGRFSAVETGEREIRPGPILDLAEVALFSPPLYKVKLNHGFARLSLGTTVRAATGFCPAFGLDSPPLVLISAKKSLALNG
jgi:hypothetical protein